MIEFSAITLEDNYITFNLGDCPTMLKLNVMYLAAKPGSELFYEDTVVRVDKQYGYAEGDRVLNSNNKCIGYIIYNQGFKLQDMRGSIKEICEYKHIKIVKGTHSDRAKIIASENRDKILSILEFKIPYYIGPLSGDKSRFGWMIRQTEGKIYPWNFDDMVDKDKSAEEFIARMRNSCTYLPEADVIPKCSLLYTEYEVRSEIKQIKLDDHFMSLSLQNDLYEELFKTQKNIKEAAFRKWLKQKGLTPVKITGYQKDGEFATSLKPYIDFKAIFGKVDYSNKEMIENIIHWLTVFNEKEIIERKIKT